MTIPRIRFRHPRRNLTGASRCVTAEDRFTLGFARAYIDSIGAARPGNADSGMSYAREIPTARFGITDFVAVSWRAMSPSGKTVRAFEMKLTDWRKAILQAHRYRYFADVAIANNVFVKFGRKSMTRLGSIKLGRAPTLRSESRLITSGKKLKSLKKK